MGELSEAPALEPDVDLDAQGQVAWLGRTIVDTPSLGKIRGLGDGLTLVLVSKHGVIEEVVRGDDTMVECRAAQVEKELGPAAVRRLRGDREFLVPGFIDLHTHWSQLPYTGTGVDRPLMADDGFLNKHAFPTEASFKDEVVAKRVYTAAVNEMLKHGTTTAVIYASAHRAACDALVDAVLAKGGPRSFVGKVCMDRHCPDFYVETTAASLAGTEAFIKRTRARDSERRGAQACERNTGQSDAAAEQPFKRPRTSRGEPPLVEPVVTPRFLPTCTPELLSGLGALAERYDAPIQSHLSESVDELAFSKAMYPNFATDAEAFDHFGLLRAPSVMGHCVHLEGGEEALLARRGASIAHCPLSNFFFAKEALPVRQLVARGIKVGLATDIAGGYSPSMLNAMRMAVIASKTLQFRRGERSAAALALPPTPEARLAVAPQASAPQSETALDDALRARHDLSHFDALWLATQAGADALGLGEQIGTFDVGKAFDALVLEASPTVLAFEDGTAEAPDDVLQKIITLGDDRNVAEVYVSGVRVK